MNSVMKNAQNKTNDEEEQVEKRPDAEDRQTDDWLFVLNLELWMTLGAHCKCEVQTGRHCPKR